MTIILFTIVLTDGTVTPVEKEHTGNEFNELQDALQRDGLTITTGYMRGSWYPFHAIKRIDWKRK